MNLNKGNEIFSLQKLLFIFVSLALLGISFWLVGIENVVVQLKALSLEVVFVIFILQSSNLLVVSFRFWRLLTHFGVKLPLSLALRANISGYVAALFMISLFGQVLGRQLVLRSYGVPAIIISGLATYERMVLFVVSGLSCLIGMIWIFGRDQLIDIVNQWSIYSLVLAVVLSFIASLAIGHSTFERNLLKHLVVWSQVKKLIEIVVISIMGFLLTKVSELKEAK